MQTLAIVEDSNADLRQKLKVKEQARKSSDSTLKGAETQAESQRKLANEVKGQLVAAKEQIAALKQQLKEANKLKDLAEKVKLQAEEDKVKAEKERDEAEQHGYDVGIAETEDGLGLRSSLYVVPTVPKPRKRLLTRLGLKLHLS